MKSKKIFLLFIVFFIQLSAIAQIAIERKYYKSGKIKSEEFYKNGKPYGIWKTYYENGNLESQMDFSSNIKLSYYEHGKIKTRSEPLKYSNFIRVKVYDTNGDLVIVGFFKDNTFRDGVEKHYEKNKLIFRYFYKNGKMFKIEKVKK